MAAPAVLGVARPNARRRALQVSVLVAIGLHGLVFSVPRPVVRPAGGPSASAGPAVQVLSLGLAPTVTVVLSQAEVLPIGLPAAPASQRRSSRPAAVPQSRALADDDYLPRDMLSAAPKPVDAVVIDYPPQPADAAETHLSGELTLFIDDDGHVVRVRAEGPPLPAALEASARRAFMSARFTPGRVEAWPVRSRIRIEVRFDSSPVPG